MNENTSKRDDIYAKIVASGDFVFDETTANVFEDMIKRSIPGYSTIISMIGVLAKRYYQSESNIYDLGCSIGGATFSICAQLQNEEFSLIAVDNSPAMIKRMEEKKTNFLRQGDRVETRCENIQNTPIKNASVIVLNFTLQFLPMSNRLDLINKIYAGMRPNGILIISEKIVFPDNTLNTLLINMYHQFKENNGYSKLEISQKRAALENVLTPETIDAHRCRLESAGFGSFDVWFQCFNFASMIAIK